MPRNRQDVPREQRVEQLLEIAQEHFVTRGYAGTAVADIARAAGIEPGSVYWYFRSKDAAFAAVLDRLLALDRAAVEAAGPDPGRQLLAAVERYEARADLHVCAAERGRLAEPVERSCARRLEWLRGLTRRALADRGTADPDLAAEALLAAVHGAVGGPVAPTRLARFLLAALPGEGEGTA